MMLFSYANIALRNLLAHKLYSAINILGLAAGLACCLLISLFVRYELSYDAFFPNADRIYRLSADFAATSRGPERHSAANVGPVAPLIASSNIDGVQQVARFVTAGQMLVARDDVAFYEDNVRYADSAFFNIFDFEWLRGDEDTAFREPSGAVITASFANKYFGDENPLGKTLMLGNTWTITVKGVIADIPGNSHFAADVLLQIDMLKTVMPFDLSTNWSAPFFHTYLLLEPQTDIGSVVDEIASVVDATLAGNIGELFGIPPGGLAFTPFNLADIHLHSDRSDEFNSGSLVFVWTFSVIAAGLLLIACFNFMNLSTARAAGRAKEVGMRKAIGATRRQLIGQFLAESFMFTGLALCLALMMVELLLPVFSNVVGRDLAFGVLASAESIVFIATITLLTALGAGSYPAFRLSAFNPVHVLRLQGGGTTGSFTLRNVLVVFQFTLAIALLVATMVVQLQMQFVRNIDLGFDKNQVLVLRGTETGGLGRQWNVLKQELLRHQQISHVSEGDMMPGKAGTNTIRLEGGDPAGAVLGVKPVGFGFFQTYDIALVAGRYFDDAVMTDASVAPMDATERRPAGGSYVLNESAVRTLGLTVNEALDRRIEMAGIPGPIVGVVEDVYLHSLHTTTRPLVYFVPVEFWGGVPSFDTASVRITGAQPDAVVEWIRARWKLFVPEQPLQYHFLDTDFDALYLAEERQGRLFTFFAVLTIFIACLGLFGLASFAVERRIKEIGVRKVMGGTVWSIVQLLTNDFSKLVLVANLIAWPFAWFAMSRWLETFAYRIDLTPMVFIGSGLIALCIAWVTVGSTAANAASAKPVLALRYE